MRAWQSIRSMLERNSRSSSVLVRKYFARGPDGAPTLVTMPIGEDDQFTVTDAVNGYHPHARKLRVGKDKDGCILFIGTGLGNVGAFSSLFDSREGLFKFRLVFIGIISGGLSPGAYYDLNFSNYRVWYSYNFGSDLSDCGF